MLSGKNAIHIIHVRLVVLRMMDLHRRRINIRLESIIRIRQRWQSKRRHLSNSEIKKKDKQKQTNNVSSPSFPSMKSDLKKKKKIEIG
mmetsp:Transcript_12950/g.26262  ORF Transcript_12950/g.26262 Transcript_12950/m.26262 type:complete len:88 (-) Transcript_12950:72-335(-)